MARFEMIDSKNLKTLRGKERYIVSGSLTMDDVERINKAIVKIILIFENTKGQNSEIIRKISPDVSMSIMGGINYLKKEKYCRDKLVELTFYTPNEMAAIINKFEAIERRIDYTWSDIEKAMFVYKTMVESMQFDMNGKLEHPFYCRKMSCLLYGNAVCMGFALAFKEAMDRLGIECLFQNKTGEHCWNALKIDGEYYLLDLTWDVCRKTDNVCQYRYFGKDDGNTFYKNTHHNIEEEKEEIALPAVAISENKINEIRESIETSRYTYSSVMSTYRNDKNEEFNYYMFKDFDLHRLYIVEHNDKIDYFYCRKDDDIKKYLDNNFLSIVNLSYNHNVNREPIEYLKNRIAAYERNDKSSFIVLKGNKIIDDKIYEYCIIEVVEVDGEKRLRRVNILSENNLTEKSENYKFDNYIANWLLGKERVNDKVEHFNGYVGHIKNRDRVYSIVYNREFERNKLNILNRN